MVEIGDLKEFSLVFVHLSITILYFFFQYYFVILSNIILYFVNYNFVFLSITILYFCQIQFCKLITIARKERKSSGLEEWRQHQTTSTPPPSTPSEIYSF